MAAPATLVVACLFTVLAMIAAVDLEWIAWALLNVPAILLVARTLYECASATAALKEVVSQKPADLFKPDAISKEPRAVAAVTAKLADGRVI